MQPKFYKKSPKVLLRVNTEEVINFAYFGQMTEIADSQMNFYKSINIVFIKNAIMPCKEV